MNSRTARVAWSVCAVSLFLMAFGLLVIFLGWSTPLSAGWYPWSNLVIEALGLLGLTILGGSSPRAIPRTAYGRTDHFRQLP
jgi:hypothetical protein